MSVYTVSVSERGKNYIIERYAVEAANASDACQMALGAHALEEHGEMTDYEVVAFEKSTFRHVLTAEHVQEHDHAVI